ncbi:Dihydroneopterin aldolase [Anoxybacillus sp. P3H1B]|jgi:7,8-dihydroneopterin aldolase/epimerase/oxygenase|nr:dihydroneopterin aldolase [Anoxybacillus rupiensis]KXG08240.1 Dihydroneopterin aldolase [Anoxybacillus sp. P3H1B]MBB3909132.1 dihydroneopterin aldolase [Anoxybacillus rupiensis]
MAIDKIYLNAMEFYGYHGAIPEENRLGQRFIVDLVIETDLKKAGESDCLDDTINYAALYEICREIVEEQRFKLIEAVAEQIACHVLSAFSSILQCTVKVVKPNPPIKGHYQSVAVEIVRRR